MAEDFVVEWVQELGVGLLALAIGGAVWAAFTTVGVVLGRIITRTTDGKCFMDIPAMNGAGVGYPPTMQGRCLAEDILRQEADYLEWMDRAGIRQAKETEGVEATPATLAALRLLARYPEYPLTTLTNTPDKSPRKWD